MKIFIIFLALTVINSSGLVFLSDYNNFIMIHKNLKAAAEECAISIALSYDQDLYGMGEYYISDEVAEEVGIDSLKHINDVTPSFRNGDVRIAEIDSKGLAVSVKLVYEQEEDLFRLPFVERHAISASSTYRWEGT